MTQVPSATGRCRVCRALVDDDDLFCPNCGTELPERATAPAARPAKSSATSRFTCQGCGASMSYDATVQALRCPYCGSKRIEHQPDAPLWQPARVIPLRIDQAGAEQRLSQFLQARRWAPSDLLMQARLQHMRAVYVPCWIYSVSTETHWTADTSQLPLGSSGDWRPIAGEFQSRYDDIFVPASSVLTHSELAAIGPFDLRESVPPEQIDLKQAIFEEFRVSRREARRDARQLIEAREIARATSLVPKRSRNVAVNVLLSDLASEPWLVPVWVLAYQYDRKIYRVLINGQTGQVSGQAPISWWKTLLVVLTIVLALGLLAFVFAAAAR